MSTFEVELAGTWTRRNTTLSDLAYIRDQLRRFTNDQVRVSFTEKKDLRTPRMSKRGEVIDRGGTFKAVVTVHRQGFSYADRRVLKRRALQQLKWFLDDISCRGAQLTAQATKWTRRSW